MNEIWRDRRAEIGEQNRQVRIAFSRTLPAGGVRRSELSDAPVRAMLENLRASFDARHGGFGAAPKFPHPTDLELCLRKDDTGIAHTTLTRRCEGGIYDQLGGGFCRYSVDQHWTIPHFEKMLYDNGPLLHLLADGWLVTGDGLRWGAAYLLCAAQVGWFSRQIGSFRWITALLYPVPLVFFFAERSLNRENRFNLKKCNIPISLILGRKRAK